MQQVGLDASVNRPIGVNLPGELGTQKSPRDLIKLFRGQLDRQAVLTPD